MGMLVYGIVPGLTQTTNATPATETNGMYVAVGAGRNISILSLSIMGKGAGVTTLSGIAFRVRRYTTASTAGTGITPSPRDPGIQAAKATAAYGGTTGSGGATLQLAIGCGVSSPGGWAAANPDAAITLEAGSGDSLDVLNASGTASLSYEESMDVFE